MIPAGLGRFRSNPSKGLLDLVVVYRGVTHWIEVKRPKIKTTPEQNEFISCWTKCGGNAHVVYSLDDVIAIIPGPQLRMKLK